MELTNWGVSSTPTQQGELSGYQYFIWSNGPDTRDYSIDHSQKAFEDVLGLPNAQYGLFYEPTNGTVSEGDLVRCPKLAR